MAHLLPLLGGLIALVAGSDLLVRGALAIARHYRVSPLLIGVTLVGFGTSLPELVASVQAALAGSPGIAVGNVVGSNICNILLVLGVGALVRPMPVPRDTIARDTWIMMASALALVAMVPAGALGRPAGLVLTLLLAGYLYTAQRSSRVAVPDKADRTHAHLPARHLRIAVPGVAIGLVLTIAGAHWFVAGAIELAGSLAVSESLIGLTVAAVGTSMPELATSIAAAVRRQADVAIGNIIGSNIFNVFGILGVVALVQPIDLPTDIASFDIWVMLAATLLLVTFAIRGWRLSRIKGGLFLAGYGAYVTALALRA